MAIQTIKLKYLVDDVSQKSMTSFVQPQTGFKFYLLSFFEVSALGRFSSSPTPVVPRLPRRARRARHARPQLKISSFALFGKENKKNTTKPKQAPYHENDQETQCKKEVPRDVKASSRICSYSTHLRFCCGTAAP